MTGEMKLVKYRLLPESEKLNAARLVGVKENTPVFSARRGRGAVWKVKALEESNGEYTDKTDVKTREFHSLEALLRYFKSHKITPYAIKKHGEAGSPSPRRNVRKTAPERRKFFRKAVNLAGEYVNRRSGERQDIRVTDVSFNGISFATPHRHKMLENDTLSVTFHLDDPKNSKIVRNVRITRITKSITAGEFINRPAYDKSLGFYFLG